MIEYKSVENYIARNKNGEEVSSMVKYRSHEFMVVKNDDCTFTASADRMDISFTENSKPMAIMTMQAHIDNILSGNYKK